MINHNIQMHLRYLILYLIIKTLSTFIQNRSLHPKYHKIQKLGVKKDIKTGCTIFCKYSQLYH